ncbi:MAG: glycosyltransferase family 4 protein [Clostridiaceae bacterium]|nr:glycosyltransferase family 4 protein [Clostridiaceae bacterium]
MFNILIALMGLEIGGAETHVVELAKGLKKEGFNVIVASNGGVYEKELLESGIKHYSVPLHNKKPHNVLRSYFLLKKIIVNERIDLVHAHARIPAFICNLLHNKMGFPFVTTAHWVFKTGWGLKYITPWGQKTLAVSEDIKKYLMDNYGIDEKNITVTINGIDTEKFIPDLDVSDIVEEFDIDKKNKHIVYVSRLDSDRSKVAFQLLQIAPELANELGDIDIIIVGGGNVFDRLFERAQEVNRSIGRRLVIMTGGRTDINKFVSLSHVFIGVSRSALEAMSAEKPVILAGNEGYIGILDEDKLRKAIHTNFTCRGETKSQEDKLKEDIIRVIRDMSAEEIRKMGIMSRKVIEERYSVKKMVSDNIKVYLQLLS